MKNLTSIIITLLIIISCQKEEESNLIMMDNKEKMDNPLKDNVTFSKPIEDEDEVVQILLGFIDRQPEEEQMFWATSILNEINIKELERVKAKKAELEKEIIKMRLELAIAEQEKDEIKQKLEKAIKERALEVKPKL